MKIISRENLIKIIKKLDPKKHKYLDLRDFEKILERYGGEQFIVDGRLEIVEKEIEV